jgi:hypothetical protein
VIVGSGWRRTVAQELGPLARTGTRILVVDQDRGSSITSSAGRELDG